MTDTSRTASNADGAPDARSAQTHRPNLLGNQNPTLLPADGPDAAARAELAGGEPARQVAVHHPASSLVWATLAREALDAGDDVTAYAFARTGYHRGLDALRGGGWRGQGPIPADHEPNAGVLMAIMALADAASAIGEDSEATRCEQLLVDSDPTARAALG